MATNDTINHYELNDVVESEYDYADLDSVKKKIDDELFYDDVANVRSEPCVESTASEPAKETGEYMLAIRGSFNVLKPGVLHLLYNN